MLRHYPLRRLAYIASHSDSNFLMNLRTAHSMTLRPFALAAGAVAPDNVSIILLWGDYHNTKQRQGAASARGQPKQAEENQRFIR